MASLRKNASKEGNKMAEQIRAEEGAIKKGATAVDNARSGIENRIKDIEAKMAELGSFWSGDAAVSFNALMSEKLAAAKLKEFVGHTPLQVIAGILLGVVNALILFNAIL